MPGAPRGLVEDGLDRGESYAASNESLAADIYLDISFAGSADWLVPAALSVLPGLLILLSLVAQLLGGILWIPVAQRFVGDGSGRADRRDRSGR